VWDLARHRYVHRPQAALDPILTGRAWLKVITSG
jgi:hypothetical protein